MIGRNIDEVSEDDLLELNRQLAVQVDDVVEITFSKSTRIINKVTKNGESVS